MIPADIATEAATPKPSRRLGYFGDHMDHGFAYQRPGRERNEDLERSLQPLAFQQQDETSDQRQRADEQHRDEGVGPRRHDGISRMAGRLTGNENRCQQLPPNEARPQLGVGLVQHLREHLRRRRSSA